MTGTLLCQGAGGPLLPAGGAEVREGTSVSLDFAAAPWCVGRGEISIAV